jgi:hypothetical protein
LSLDAELRRHAFDRIVEDGDLDGYVAELEARLAATGPGPFADAVGSRFADDAAELAAWLDAARDDLTTRADQLGMLYVEMNGFALNPERWFASAIGFASPVVADGTLHERFWREIGDHGPDHALTGMERMQAAFAQHHAARSTGRDQDAAESIATRLVHGRFLRHVASAVELLGSWPDELEIAATTHDLDPTVRFRGGRLVVESRQRRPLTSADRRRLDVPIDREGYYELLLLEGDRDIHPAAATDDDADLRTFLRLAGVFRRDHAEEAARSAAGVVRVRLTLTQEVFEDAIPAFATPIVSDDLVRALEELQPGALVTAPVTVVATRSGERRTYHLARAVVTLPSRPGRGCHEPRTIARSEVEERHVFGVERGWPPSVACVSGEVLHRLSELGCTTGLEPRTIAVVDG